MIILYVLILFSQLHFTIEAWQSFLNVTPNILISFCGNILHFIFAISFFLNFQQPNQISSVLFLFRLSVTFHDVQDSAGMFYYWHLPSTSGLQ